MEQIETLLDLIVGNEGTPDVLQVSGGEPTVHPQFFEILDACRRRPIRHLMVNTNGIRIAKEEGFAERLATYMPGFELYLQFDGLDDAINRQLRAANMQRIREQALEKLNRLNVSTTLVMTVKRGLNDDKIGEVLRFATQNPCIRGVTIQPVYDSGRNLNFDATLHRLTVSEVRRRVYEQFPVFSADDIIPVPCHPDSVAMAYALRGPGEKFTQLTPLTHMLPPEVLIEGGKNTIIYEGDTKFLTRATQEVFKAFSTAHGPEGASRALQTLLCCLPQIGAAPSLTYDRVFRVIIMQFLDQHSMDLRSVRKSCVHIAHPDRKRLIPFDTYNIFYRDKLEQEVLVPIRKKLRPS